MNKITLIGFLLGCVLAGCNTTRGVGQDIEATGQAIEEAAEETKDELTDDDR